MRKKIIDQAPQNVTPAKQSWLELEHLAQIELTSEDEAHPFESALASDGGAGWMAAQPGEQTIRIVFDEPQKIRRIQLLFREKEQERTQEFLLSWLSAGDQSYKEIVRQQYNFSPPHTIEESEDYTVDLEAVRALVLHIVPDTSGRGTCASLAQLKLS